jgi:hypothetical protein
MPIIGGKEEGIFLFKVLKEIVRGSLKVPL